MKKGIFLSDIHLPDNISLKGIIDYVGDLRPDVIILGGDIIDGEGLHASESMKAEEVKMSWFERDVELARNFIADLRKASPKASVVYLEGNHEQRYARLQTKYPELFKKTLDFRGAMKPLVEQYIPYATAQSYYRLGDTVFVHGDIFPDLHAKPYALRYSPLKVIYGHMHHFQAYTVHRALMHQSNRYGVTAGCLSTLNPAWKRGQANQWVNGFVSFTFTAKVLIPTIHLMEHEVFSVGGKVYGGVGPKARKEKPRDTRTGG